MDNLQFTLYDKEMMMKNMQHTLCLYIITSVREIEEGFLTITFQQNL